MEVLFRGWVAVQGIVHALILSYLAATRKGARRELAFSRHRFEKFSPAPGLNRKSAPIDGPLTATTSGQQGSLIRLQSDDVRSTKW